MKHKKLKLCVLLLGFCFAGVQAQNLDRVTISSGGDATGEVSYVIGEPFNFALAEGNITLETGSQGSIDNTGGVANYTTIEQVAELKGINCYPNPVTDIIYFNLQGEQADDLTILIFDTAGKLVQTATINYAEIMSCNVESLANGTYFISLGNKQGVIYGASKFVKQ